MAKETKDVYSVEIVKHALDGIVNTSSLAYGLRLSDNIITDTKALPKAFGKLNAVYQVYVKNTVSYFYALERWVLNKQKGRDDTVKKMLTMFRTPPPELFAEYVYAKKHGFEEAPLFRYAQEIGLPGSLSSLFDIIAELMQLVSHSIRNGMQPSFDIRDMAARFGEVYDSDSEMARFAERHRILAKEMFSTRFYAGGGLVHTIDDNSEKITLRQPEVENRIVYSSFFFPANMIIGDSRLHDQNEQSLFFFAGSETVAQGRHQKEIQKPYYISNLSDELIADYSVFNIYQNYFIENRGAAETMLRQRTKRQLERSIEENDDPNQAMEQFLYLLAKKRSAGISPQTFSDAYILMQFLDNIEKERSRKELRIKAREIMAQKELSPGVRFGILRIHLQQHFYKALAGTRSETHFFTDHIKEAIQTEIVRLIEEIKPRTTERGGRT